MRRTRSGMSLLELMAALTVLALLATLVPPVLDGASARWRVRAAITTVEATAQRARDLAAASGAATRAVYDVEEGTLWVRDGNRIESQASLPRGVRFESVRMGNVTVTHEAASVRAFPDGTLDPHEVRLAGEGGRRARLLFLRLTGQARIVEEQSDGAP